jgi:hypothetical protein
MASAVVVGPAGAPHHAQQIVSARSAAAGSLIIDGTSTD